jgi:IclR family transcriptional regulator, mhp operon transcriptional activator
MMTAGVKSIEALRRGLEVITVLEQSSAATLSELHRHTRFSKATLLRILRTLDEAGWIERHGATRRYALRSGGGHSRAADWRARLSLLVAPHRAELQRRVLWPVDMATRDGTAMLILDAQRPINGLAVNYRALGFRPLMLVSSLGRCYLAFCGDAERREIIQELSRSTKPLQRIALRTDVVRKMVSTARVQGYAARDASETEGDSAERFGAIAAPVFCGDQIVAALSCSWLPGITNEREIVARHLKGLQDTALAMAERLRSAGFDPQRPTG